MDKDAATPGAEGRGGSDEGIGGEEVQEAEGGGGDGSTNLKAVEDEAGGGEKKKRVVDQMTTRRGTVITLYSDGTTALVPAGEEQELVQAGLSAGVEVGEIDARLRAGESLENATKPRAAAGWRQQQPPPPSAGPAEAGGQFLCSACRRAVRAQPIPCGRCKVVKYCNQECYQWHRSPGGGDHGGSRCAALRKYRELMVKQGRQRSSGGGGQGRGHGPGDVDPAALRRLLAGLRPGDRFAVRQARCDAFAGAGDHAAAERELRVMIEEEGPYPYVYLVTQLAREIRDDGKARGASRADEALEVLRGGVGRCPDPRQELAPMFAAYRLMGDILREDVQDMDGSLAAYRSALALRPDDEATQGKVRRVMLLSALAQFEEDTVQEYYEQRDRAGGD
jgi:hypothetical protein